MSTLKSNHNSSSEESLLNLEHNKKLVQDLKNKISEISKGGKEASVKKHQERGKLLVRDRIDLLIDSDTPFLELSSSTSAARASRSPTPPRSCKVVWLKTIRRSSWRTLRSCESI